jgi:hypothetical protein
VDGAEVGFALVEGAEETVGLSLGFARPTTNSGGLSVALERNSSPSLTGPRFSIMMKSCFSCVVRTKGAWSNNSAEISTSIAVSEKVTTKVTSPVLGEGVKVSPVKPSISIGVLGNLTTHKVVSGLPTALGTCSNLRKALFCLSKMLSGGGISVKLNEMKE